MGIRYYHTRSRFFRQGKNGEYTKAPSLEGAFAFRLLLAEGLAVGALILGRIDLVGAHQDPVQRAVVLVLAVVCTLLHGAFDALVGMTIHKIASFDLDSRLVWLDFWNLFWERFPVLHFAGFCDMVNYITYKRL